MLPAKFHAVSCDRKLSPVDLVDVGFPRPRPTPRAPFCSSTYTSIHGTCSDDCPLKRAGCYVDAGFTKFANDKLDQALLGKTPEQVIAIEVRLIDEAFPQRLIKGRFGMLARGGVPQDGARGGRELRLHVGGDAPSEACAKMLAGAADRWRARGGGRVWSYTHSYRTVRRQAWGSVAVLASVEKPEQVAVARAQGYAPAVLVPEFPNGKRLFEFGGAQIIPCPVEATPGSGKTCIQGCRLCLGEVDLYGKNQGIGFAVHGPEEAKVQLTVRPRAAALAEARDIEQDRIYETERRGG